MTVTDKVQDSNNSDNSKQQKSPQEIISPFNLSLNQGIAKELGIAAALIFNHILYWLRINAVKKEPNIIHDKIWMYETHQAIADSLGCLTLDEVKKAIKVLIDSKFIIKDNFNKDPFNKTSWFTVYDQSLITDKKSVGKRDNSKKSYDSAVRHDGECAPAPSDSAVRHSLYKDTIENELKDLHKKNELNEFVSSSPEIVSSSFSSSPKEFVSSAMENKDRDPLNPDHWTHLPEDHPMRQRWVEKQGPKKIEPLPIEKPQAMEVASFSGIPLDINFDPNKYRLKNGQGLSKIMIGSLVTKIKEPHQKAQIMRNLAYYEESNTSTVKNHEAYLQKCISEDYAKKGEYEIQNDLYAKFVQLEKGIKSMKILKTVVQLFKPQEKDPISVDKDLPPQTFANILNNHIENYA